MQREGRPHAQTPAESILGMDPRFTEPTSGLPSEDVAHARWRYMAASLGDSTPDHDDYAAWDAIRSDLGSDTRAAVCAVLRLVSAAPG